LIQKILFVLIHLPQLWKKNEKLLVNDFPALAPDNIVTADYSLILDFLHAKGEIIIKPLNRCFTSGVFYLNKDDKNINTIIKTATQDGKTTVMVQEFLPAVSNGDRRLIFCLRRNFDYCALSKNLPIMILNLMFTVR
jgi:glutathione synthase